MIGCLNLVPMVAPACLLVDPACVAVGIASSSRLNPDFAVEYGPDQVENAMREDDSDDEPVDIVGDNDENTLTIGQQPNIDATFQSQGLHDATALTEDWPKSKEEVVLSVKDYRIRRGVEYRVMESDHLKYHGRCKEFGKSCTWMIHITLRQKKSTWEVRRYNGPHTCLATSISSDHRQLDYIFPLVRADAAVTIKVLQQATEAAYRFKPSYRNVWMAKQKAVAQIYDDWEEQKAVAQIYGDWEEPYGELPGWILGVTSTMEGTIILLKTSPVRVGDQVDVSTVYFHSLFWTFLPCIEAFDTASH
ncbi:uncharacterized protein LOC107611574 [Arachis ipaensis]|uniref:uncharacterized protein LOC107611574 n=1 Tax=Arachis ipaensis TaxID=130454 RepID=UPI0007AF0631|nr:uncharacterized protein LOC107611574 [Arachis ipaensis]